MGVNVREFLQILFAVLRRRWFVIVLPIIVFFGLSVVAYKYWPRAYIASTLIMLQEGSAADPLGGGGQQRRRTQLLTAALDTLLKSERVLRGAVLDFNLGKELSAKQFENEIEDLREQIFVSIVGQEFIRIEFRDGNPNGIADKLSTIVTRFLERLFSRQDAIKTAREFALERRKRDLEIAERALLHWFQQHPQRLASGASKDELKRLEGMRKRRADAEKRLIDAASTVIQGPLELTNILATLAQSRQLSFGASNSQQSPGMEKLQLVFEDYEVLNKSIVAALQALISTARQQMRVAGAQGSDFRELMTLGGRYDEALEQFRAHRAQANKSRAPTLPPFGLINAELIRIIDEPKDPASPATSILKIILACWAAGIGLGFGLAALIEQIDDTLYDAGELSRLSGVDLIIEMPPLKPKSADYNQALVPPS